MTDTQKPEALRLADALAWNESRDAEQAAACLRRLQAENEALRTANERFNQRQWSMNDKMHRLENENEALRKAYALLENFAQSVGGSSSFWEDFNEELEAASCIVNFGSKT